MNKERHWCPHCQLRIEPKWTRHETGEEDLVCPYCDSPDIEAFKDEDQWNPSAREKLI